MPQTTTTTIDPVSRHLANSHLVTGSTPVPLIATSYDISISGGLADVVSTRTFRNAEANTIEATLTFPLPVDAVLYSLEARIGGRLLKAVAKAKSQARETYEDALDRGKTSVLHEELIKGVHLLSVGHVAPGTEIEITARFAIALSSISGRALVTIPTTVGEIYGASGLPDSDDLIHGGGVSNGTVSIRSDSGLPKLSGAVLVDSRASVPLNRPIHIEVLNWKPRDLYGRAADGRSVSLSIVPLAVLDARLSASILVDHSGSMNEVCALGSDLTKHAAAVLGLSEAADTLKDGDKLHLWEFDDRHIHLGTTDVSGWRPLLRKLSQPHGGTEIGRALYGVVMGVPCRDVILITDGKSHAIDVQFLVRSGRRFTVVLIGEDSLDANVGHLASLSGGQIFIAADANVTDAVKAALASVRMNPLEWTGNSDEIEVSKAGMAVRASWPDGVEIVPEETARVVAAYAAHLKMARLKAEEAAPYAEAEGLVTHLTSLILVDEEGAAQSGLPATRKVALPSPATAAACFAGAPTAARQTARMMLPAVPARGSQKFLKGVPKRTLAANDPEFQQRALQSLARKRSQNEPVRNSYDLGRNTLDAIPEALGCVSEPFSPRELALAMPWRTHAVRLARGHYDDLDADTAGFIRKASARSELVACAVRLGVAPDRLVIAILADAASGINRFAARVARAILGRTFPAEARFAGHLLGFEDPPAAAVG